MAKLTRVPLKPFAGDALLNEVSQFGSVVEGTKLHTLDISTIQALDSWLAGFSKALISGNRYPSYQEVNGVLKVLSYEQAYQLQEGIAEYDSATPYYIGSIVKKTGTFELYGSLTDTNVGNALTDDTKWQYLGDLSNLASGTTDTIIPLGTISSGTITLTEDKFHTVTFSGAATITLPTDLTSGVHYNCSLLVTMSSIVTITQPTVTWIYSVSPSMTSTTAKYRLTYETVDGGTTWYGYWTQLGS